MRSVRTSWLFALVVLGAFVLGFGLGTRAETQATLVLSGPEHAPAGVDLAPVWKAWRLLEEKYVPATTSEPITKQDKVWHLIEGLAKGYGDPYTVFMPPEESKAFEEEISGSFGGVGMEMGMRNNVLTVIAPLKGTPADHAGIRAGDLIVEINHESTRDISIDEAVRQIRGEAGTTVDITLAREAERELIELTLTREKIEIPTIETSSPEPGIRVITLYNFGATATLQFRTALREFVESGDTKLIIDLRGNPGGYLEAAVEIASLFLPMGKVVVAEDFGDTKEPLAHRSKGYNVARDTWRIAVLVDGGSASASEIVAGALQEHGKAKLIGTQTFGKGSVQELVHVTPDTSLKITVARWLTPNGISISDGGLTPDLVVEPRERTDESLEDTPENDPQLQAALLYLKNGVLPEPVVKNASSSPALDKAERE